MFSSNRSFGCGNGSFFVPTNASSSYCPQHVAWERRFSTTDGVHVVLLDAWDNVVAWLDINWWYFARLDEYGNRIHCSGHYTTGVAPVACFAPCVDLGARSDHYTTGVAHDACTDDRVACFAPCVDLGARSDHYTTGVAHDACTDAHVACTDAHVACTDAHDAHVATTCTHPSGARQTKRQKQLAHDAHVPCVGSVPRASAPRASVPRAPPPCKVKDKVKEEGAHGSLCGPISEEAMTNFYNCPCCGVHDLEVLILSTKNGENSWKDIRCNKCKSVYEAKLTTSNNTDNIHGGDLVVFRDIENHTCNVFGDGSEWKGVLLMVVDDFEDYKISKMTFIPKKNITLCTKRGSCGSCKGCLRCKRYPGLSVHPHFKDNKWKAQLKLESYSGTIDMQPVITTFSHLPKHLFEELTTSILEKTSNAAERGQLIKKYFEEFAKR